MLWTFPLQKKNAAAKLLVMDSAGQTVGMCLLKRREFVMVSLHKTPIPIGAISLVVKPGGPGKNTKLKWATWGVGPGCPNTLSRSGLNASLSGSIAVPLCMPMCFVDMLSHSSVVFAIHIVSDTFWHYLWSPLSEQQNSICIKPFSYKKF